MMPLIISVLSLILSCTAYCKMKKHQRIQEIYIKKLKQKQIDLNTIYGVVREKRNAIHKQKIYLEHSHGRNVDVHVQSLVIADEYLEDIENCIQNIID